jgi:hypothetical protein
MTPFADRDGPLPFRGLATRIRSSSNFRVASQLFQWEGPCPATPRTAKQALETIVLVPELQTFLTESLDAHDKSPFQIAPLHEECSFEQAHGAFERTLARAAADRLGAYSRILAEAIPRDVEAVQNVFEALGPYVPFEFPLGQPERCTQCSRKPREYFSSWFYGVAWDYCFCVIWESCRLVWIGCMTDTD